MARYRKRVAFSTPFVLVVSCDRPVAHHHHHHEVAVHADAGADAYFKPEALVDDLPPLTKDRTFEDACRHALCNPPPPYAPRRHPPKPDPLGSALVEVDKMMREPTGTRVRAYRHDWRFDETWHAKFVTQLDQPIADGDCAITGWDFRTIECTTALSPEQLAIKGQTYPLQIDPPPELVAKVERERTNWREPPPIIMRVGVPSLDGDVVTIRIGQGFRAGIAHHWRAVLFDDQQHELGDCEISMVAPDETVCRATASFGVLAKSVHLFEPP